MQNVSVKRDQSKETTVMDAFSLCVRVHVAQKHCERVVRMTMIENYFHGNDEQRHFYQARSFRNRFNQIYPSSDGMGHDDAVSV